MSSWCDWNNNHSSLTGLVPAMYMNRAGEPVPNPNPLAELGICAWNGDLVKAVIPAE